MKPLFLICLCALSLLPAVCFAQAASGPFADVLTGRWEYVAVQTIQGAGIATSYPDGTYGGRRTMTRIEFVSLLDACLLRIQTPNKNAPVLLLDAVTKFEQCPPALNALLALVDEFAPEMKRKGIDGFAAKASLQTLQTQIRDEIRSGNLTLTDENRASPFYELPRNDTAYHYADTIMKAGIVIGIPPPQDWPGSTFGWLPVTRLQMAQSIDRVFLLANANSRFADDINERLGKNPKALAAFNLLIDQFVPELKLVGEDAALYHSRLASLTPQFPDVPKNHWAYSAVLTLRQNGIMQGYPSGTLTTAANQEKPL